MPTSSSTNIEQKLKERIKFFRRDDESFCRFSAIVPGDLDGKNERLDAINPIMEKLLGNSDISKAEFKRHFGTDAISNYRIGQERVFIVFYKLYSEVINEELNVLMGDCKDKDYIKWLADHEDGTNNLIVLSTADYDNQQITRQSIEAVTKSTEQLVITKTTISKKN